jgi:3-oxoacyl-[acyl-carrier-protein] synthase-3
MRSLIVGTGSYAPEKVLTNADLERMVETSDQWIQERTGIKERRIAAPEQASSDLALKAATQALEAARVDPHELELIVVGTVTPDYPFPSVGAVLQGKLGNKRAFALDVSAACAGSMYALSIADRYVSSGAVKNALVVGVDTLTRITDWTDRNTAILFGDAAGAMVLRPTTDPKRGILSTRLHSDGSLAHILYQPAGGSREPFSEKVLRERSHFVKMNGREVFKVAVRALAESSREVLEAEKLTPADVTYVIAHQANKRILDATLERLEIPAAKCWMNLDKYGNTSSASMPMTLDEANRAGWLKPGDVVLMMAIGGGMAWGAGLVRW